MEAPFGCWRGFLKWRGSFPCKWLAAASRALRTSPAQPGAGCRPRAPAARANTVGMQPSRKREGKSVGLGAPGHGWDAALARARGEIRWAWRAGARLGCSPRASARGSPLGWARVGTVGMQPSRKREGKPVGLGASGHGWDAALAQARGEVRWAGRDGTRLGCSPRAGARGNPLGWARPGTVGMQPSRKREGKPVGLGAAGHGWDAALAQARGQARWAGRGGAVFIHADGAQGLQAAGGWTGCPGEGRGFRRIVKKSSTTFLTKQSYRSVFMIE